MPETVRLEVCPRSDRRVEELEYEVYLRAGYIAPNPHHRVLENDDYPDHLVVAAFCGDVLAGSVRVVIDSRPQEDLFSLHCFEPFEVWPWAEEMLQEVQVGGLMQIGTMVIREEFRGGAVCQAMLQRLIEIFVEARIRFAAATIDERFFRTSMRARYPLFPWDPHISTWVRARYRCWSHGTWLRAAWCPGTYANWHNPAPTPLPPWNRRPAAPRRVMALDGKKLLRQESIVRRLHPALQEVGLQVIPLHEAPLAEIAALIAAAWRHAYGNRIRIAFSPAFLRYCMGPAPARGFALTAGPKGRCKAWRWAFPWTSTAEERSVRRY